MERHYNISKNKDGTSTVSFYEIMESGVEITEYSMPVVPFDGLEENVREHYRAWFAHVKAYCDMKETFERALCLLRMNGGYNDG